MPTIWTLIGVLVVFGLMIAAVSFLVKVLADTASRHDQSLRIDLDARRLRFKISVKPGQSRSVARLPTPDDDSPSSRASEKAS
jgi:hypothetical protein